MNRNSIPVALSKPECHACPFYVGTCEKLNKKFKRNKLSGKKNKSLKNKCPTLKRNNP